MCQDKSYVHHHAHIAAPIGSIHGHVILKWLVHAPISEGVLKARVAAEFGSSPQFHTCDRTGLSLDALLAVLAERGKISLVGNGWRSDMSKVCRDA